MARATGGRGNRSREQSQRANRPLRPLQPQRRQRRQRQQRRRKLAGITFDFDATFYNYPRMVLRLIHRYGIHTKLIYDLTKVRARLREEGYIEDFRARQVEAMAERWNKPVEWTRQKLQRVVYDGWNSAFEHVKPETGVFEMLDMVVANGLPIALISDYPPRDKMRKMGLLKYPWSVIINCEEIGLLKPDPTSFHRAMRRMGTRPEETMHVGDSLSYDIQGAKNAGMMSVWLKRWWKRARDRPRPDHTISNFDQFMALLARDFGLRRDA